MCEVGSRICILNALPGDAEDAGPWTTLGAAPFDMDMCIQLEGWEEALRGCIQGVHHILIFSLHP